jgi:hypothetical protein
MECNVDWAAPRSHWLVFELFGYVRILFAADPEVGVVFGCTVPANSPIMEAHALLVPQRSQSCLIEGRNLVDVLGVDGKVSNRHD